MAKKNRSTLCVRYLLVFVMFCNTVDEKVEKDDDLEVFELGVDDNAVDVARKKISRGAY